MKLLFVHQNLGDLGGAEVFVLLTGTELQSRGHEAALLYNRSIDHNPARWREVFRESYRVPPEGDREMIEVVLERCRPDLIFVNNWNDLGSLEIFLRSGIPVVRMVHDHSLYCMRGYKYNYFTRQVCNRAASTYCIFPCLASLVRDRERRLPVKWSSYANKKKEILLNRRCAAVLAYSEYQKRELLGNGFRPDQVHLTVLIRMTNPGGATASFSDQNLILFVGQLIRGKGVDALLRALAKLQVPFGCAIVGDGSHRARCERLCSRLKLGQKVRFEGYVLPDSLRSYYQQASVFAMSSLWPEPFGMAGPEAMQYGLPVVAFDSGAIGEWLINGDNGFLVPWNDTSAFAARLEQLLRDKALARRMGAHALHSVRRFDVARQMDAVETLFLRLAGLPGPLPARTVNSQLDPALPNHNWL